MKPKIVVTRQMAPAVLERISAEFDAILPPPGGMNPDQVLEALESSQAEGLLFNSGTPFTPDYVARRPQRLKIAASCSVGYDHVDVAAVKARGLPVSNTPGVLDASVADFAFLLILAAARRLPEYDKSVRDGWGRYFGVAEFLGTDLAGKTLGIVGMGRIGRVLARRAAAFDMTVIYHNRSRLAAADEAGATYVDTLDQLLSRSQVLSLHAPLTAESKGLLNADRIARLPKGAIVVNTARGPLVDDEALIAALQSGHLRAAGLDVFVGEPKPDPRYAGMANVVLTPHMASATDETRTAMGMLCLDNIAAVLSGRPAVTPLW